MSRLLPFVSSADDEDGKLVVDPLPPKKLENVFDLALPDGEGRGEVGLDETIRKVLRYSVNTWRDGFMDKLYASTDPVGVTSDLLLSVLNTNARIVLFFLCRNETVHRSADLTGVGMENRYTYIKVGNAVVLHLKTRKNKKLIMRSD